MEGGGRQNRINHVMPLEELEGIERLFDAESEFVMPPEYLHNRDATLLRRHAVAYFQNLYSEGQIRDASVPYVAINYFDRFISNNQVPNVLCNKQENNNLFLISCLSISWKMRVKNFDINKFLSKRGLRFGNKGLMRMEMKILNALEWRMKQIYPFRFVGYFFHFLWLPQNFSPLPVLKIVVWTQADIRFTQFRPSILAASAILCASNKLFPANSNHFRSVIMSRCARFNDTVDNELLECIGLIELVYNEKLSTLISEGSSGTAVGTSQPPNLATGEASTSLPPGSGTGQSGSTGDGKEDIQEGSHRKGKEPVIEEDNVATAKTAPEPDALQSSSTSGVDNQLMDFELEWDDDDPYDSGQCSLIDKLARCWPIRMSEAQEQIWQLWHHSCRCWQHSWEWLLHPQDGVGRQNRRQLIGSIFNEIESSSSSFREL